MAYYGQLDQWRSLVTACILVLQTLKSHLSLFEFKLYLLRLWHVSIAPYSAGMPM